jgi:Zn-dependent protease
MDPYAPRQVDPAEYERQYEPVQPRHTDWVGRAKRLATPLIVLFGVLLKLGSLAKFGAIFLAFGGYALIWGWKFALGLVVLIFVHEMGHFIEAKREGLNPSWPVFIPFLGAYVKHTGGNPWQTTRVAIAGPILGGIGALACYAIAVTNDSGLFYALAYFGFFLNAINLLPVSILDGGHIWRSTRWLWYGGARDKAYISGALYVGTILLLLLGAFEAYLPQDRL